MQVLPFSVYAACRLLDTTPQDTGNGQVYEALRTMAAYYLRADLESLCDCIQASERAFPNNTLPAFLSPQLLWMHVHAQQL